MTTGYSEGDEVSAPTRSRREVSFLRGRAQYEWAASSRFGGCQPTRGAHGVEEPREPRSSATDRVLDCALLPRLKPYTWNFSFLYSRQMESGKRIVPTTLCLSHYYLICNMKKGLLYYLVQPLNTQHLLYEVKMKSKKKD